MTETAAGVVLHFTMGDRLAKARKYTGLDQEPFAVELGVSRQTVSNYETDSFGPRGPRMIVLRAWSARTGVSLQWLRDGIGPSGPRDTGLVTGRYLTRFPPNNRWVTRIRPAQMLRTLSDTPITEEAA